jgi:NAD(P)-dependent dehydrogenase (short-subunit alcohol dehydrogenase family)
MMDINLREKVAVITGASTGIGKAIAISLAKHGASVALIGRNQDRLSLVKESILEIGAPAQIYITDLRDQLEITNTVKNIINLYPKIDILVNVAGVWHDNVQVYYGLRLDQIPIEQINEVLDVNIRAPMLLTGLLLPYMISSKSSKTVPSAIPTRSGKIINISGTFTDGGAKWLHYYVSKQALESMTKGLADELREFNVQVNCISPSDVRTDAYKLFYPDMVDLALNPDDVADLALFLVSEFSNNISGQVIVIKNHEDISPLW